MPMKKIFHDNDINRILIFHEPTRLIMKVRIAFTCILILALSQCKGPETTERPNIILAIADDWGWPHAGIYGDEVVKTPAFDRIACEGILFNHTYVSAPSCTPSRNAILTGQYHWRLGPGANLNSTLDPSIPVYPLLLEQAGYHVGSWRKSYGPGRLTAWEKHPAGKVYKGGFEEFLHARPGNAPFCFFVGASDPHRPYEIGSGKRSGMNLEDIDLFDFFPDNQDVRSDVADYYYEIQRFDRDLLEVILKLEEIGEIENTMIVVTGDNGMPFPRCKSNIYDSGVRVPMAIRWGSGISNPGRILEDFVSLSDLAPTFLEAAGVEIPGVMTGRSLTSLFTSKKSGFVEPGIRDYILVGKERHVPAQEGHLGGYPSRAIRTHDYLYIRNFESDRWPSGTPDYEKAEFPGSWLGDCDNGPTKSCIVSSRNMDDHHMHLWELAFAKRPAEELYHCRSDPDQMLNLAFNPKYAEIKEQYSVKLMEQLELYGDPRVLGEGSKFDEYPYFGGTPLHPQRKKEIIGSVQAGK